MDAVELGRIVRYHRERAGLSRERFARLAGVGKTVVFDLENGKETVKLATVLDICRALGIGLVPVSDLMEEYRASSNG